MWWVSFPELDGKLHVHPDGESWEQLRWYVERDTGLSDEAKRQIFAVIDADVNMATKKWRMNRLPTYKYLLRNYYPRIRNSMFCILYYSREAVEQFAVPSIELPDTLPFIDAQLQGQSSVKNEVVEKKKVMVAALKTNLLYDAVTALNFEVEVPLGRRFSIAFEDLFPWWHGGNKWAFQVWQMGVEGRYWFEKGVQPNLLSLAEAISVHNVTPAAVATDNTYSPNHLYSDASSVIISCKGTTNKSHKQIKIAFLLKN